MSAAGMHASHDAIVIGGGFYGARLALSLRGTGRRVVLVERESTLLARASLVNQARVHGGYHYPRSILTSLRSRRNYARFVAEYRDCVFDRFVHYYAIARAPSKVTASQFTELCRRIGAPVRPAPERVARLFDSDRIDQVLEVEECAFDAVALSRRLSRELEARGVDTRLGRAATGIDQRGQVATVRWRDGEATAPLVLNCTYAALNQLLATAGAPPIPIKRELTEMALVTPPPELDGVGVTVMDGPFFSLMPYPSRPGLTTLSHVRYTPHLSWHDAAGSTIADTDAVRAGHGATRFPHMMRDAARYLPAVRGARYVESLWEVKALMPRSEQDDSRPILFRRCAERPAIVSVLGAKIDSVYDVEDRLTASLREAAA
jgi:glycine/D-amino acid oxidase-like deaminating enzyme